MTFAVKCRMKAGKNASGTWKKNSMPLPVDINQKARSFDRTTNITLGMTHHSQTNQNSSNLFLQYQKHVIKRIADQANKMKNMIKLVNNIRF